jgi:hypothetical protein
MDFAAPRSCEVAGIAESHCSKTIGLDSRRVSVQIATRKSESAASESARRKPSTAAKRAKLSVLLVTRDDMLWPQICTHIGAGLILKQVDSIEELFSATPAGTSRHHPVGCAKFRRCRSGVVAIAIAFTALRRDRP